VVLHHHTPLQAGATMPVALAVAVAEIAITVDDPQQVVERLMNEPLVYQAGLAPEQLPELVEVIEAARSAALEVFG
jgi:hypothetical protein